MESGDKKISFLPQLFARTIEAEILFALRKKIGAESVTLAVSAWDAPKNIRPVG